MKQNFDHHIDHYIEKKYVENLGDFADSLRKYKEPQYLDLITQPVEIGFPDKDLCFILLCCFKVIKIPGLRGSKFLENISKNITKNLRLLPKIGADFADENYFPLEKIKEDFPPQRTTEICTCTFTKQCYGCCLHSMLNFSSSFLMESEYGKNILTIFCKYFGVGAVLMHFIIGLPAHRKFLTGKIIHLEEFIQFLDERFICAKEYVDPVLLSEFKTAKRVTKKRKREINY